MAVRNETGNIKSKFHTTLGRWPIPKQKLSPKTIDEKYVEYM